MISVPRTLCNILLQARPKLAEPQCKQSYIPKEGRNGVHGLHSVDTPLASMYVPIITTTWYLTM